LEPPARRCESPLGLRKAHRVAVFSQPDHGLLLAGHIITPPPRIGKLVLLGVGLLESPVGGPAVRAVVNRRGFGAENDFRRAWSSGGSASPTWAVSLWTKWGFSGIIGPHFNNLARGCSPFDPCEDTERARLTASSSEEAMLQSLRSVRGY